MSQSGYTPIQHYKSTTPSEVPVAGNLLPGELAVNIADGDMAVYMENASGVVKRVINNPAGLTYPTADGTADQVIKTDGAGNLSFTSAAASADQVSYDNTTSGLAAEEVQAAIDELADEKQDELVSGTNIKTVNGHALPGSGDVDIDADTLSLFNASGSAPVYACRAWVNFNGTGTVAIRASGNVSSITDNGTGVYTVNFTTAMPDDDYVMTASSSGPTGANAAAVGKNNTGQLTTSMDVYTLNMMNITPIDTADIWLAFFR